jgi:uncharacterized protein involved in oxidation of intracellular sulfur
MKMLYILNDAPYGLEKTYNALRIVMAIQKEHPETEIHIYLMADSVFAALKNQVTPSGYYNIERMLSSVIQKGGEVRICTTCLQARGLFDAELIDGTEFGTLKHLSDWMINDDKVIVF